MDDVPIEISTIIGKIISMIMWPALFGIVVIMFIYSGIMFALSTGDPSKITRAKNALIFAIIGLFVGIIAFSVRNILQGVLGT